MAWLPKFEAWTRLISSAPLARRSAENDGQVVGSLAVARRAPRQEVPSLGGDTVEVMFTDGEKRNVLGGDD
jgi:hypothetical protein